MPHYKYDTLTLTASNYNRKLSIELPMDSDSHELFDAFKALMVGLKFCENTFDTAVTQYFYEHGLDKDG
jgi:hypothetical protein